MYKMMYKKGFGFQIWDLPKYWTFENIRVKSLFAGIAQLVEQRIRNAWVVGSNPILGSL